MKKITLVGSAGAGKSTLAHGIFTSLKKKNINVEIAHEFIRGEVQRNGPMQSIWEQYRTRSHQKEIEDAIPQSVDVMISDCGTLSMYFYAVNYFKNNNPRDRLVLQDMYKYLIDDIYLKRYDLIFYLPATKGLIEDGTRFQTLEDVNNIDAHMRMVFTTLHKTEGTHCIDGPLDDRHDLVMKIIENNIASSHQNTYNNDIQGDKKLIVLDK